MAQVTIPIASFDNDNVQIGLTYNDQTNGFAKFEAVNNSDYPAEIRVTKPSTSLDRVFVIDAHSEVSHNVPRGLAFVMEDIGDDDGIAQHWGDIEIHCRWPT